MAQLFASKAEILVADLERRSAGYSARLLPGRQDAGTPRERIFGLFERLEKGSTEPAYPHTRAAPSCPRSSNRTPEPERPDRQSTLVFDGSRAPASSRCPG
jgi:hypothetical protein